MWRLRIQDGAKKELAGLDRPTGLRIVERLRWLVEHFEQISLEPLKGDLTGLYRYRVGDYRIVYEMVHREHSIVIHGIGHRRYVYRKI